MGVKSPGSTGRGRSILPDLRAIEENGIKFYEQAAKDAHDRREKDVYHFLASEEEIHCTILKNTLEYLENTELWEAENEGRMYDLWVNMVSKKV